MSAVKTIHQALCAITADISPVGKNNTNPQQNFKFRGIDDILNALHQLFAQHGVFIRVGEIKTIAREEKQTKSGGLLIYSINDYQFIFAASDGSEVTAWGRGEASDTADKSSNKAISAALKYCLMQMFLIPTQEDKDPDNQTIEPVADKRPAIQNRVEPEPKKPQAPTKPAITDEQAIGMIRGASTLTALQTAWSEIGPALQAYPAIMQEKETRKQQLSQPKEAQ